MNKSELHQMTKGQLDGHISALREQKRVNADVASIADSHAGKAILAIMQGEQEMIRAGYHGIDVDRPAVDVVRDLVVCITLDKKTAKDIKWLTVGTEKDEAITAELKLAHEVMAEKEAKHKAGR